MFEPDLTFENAIRFSRFDGEHLLSSCSLHKIELEEKRWSSVEHYFQHKVLSSQRQQDYIGNIADPIVVNQYAKPWYRRKVKNWKSLRRVLMTRALYTKVQMYDEVAQYLLETDDQLLAETSLYDYYWGIGRDQRGENMFGKIWMDIRSKLRENIDDTSPESSALEAEVNGHQINR